MKPKRPARIQQTPKEVLDSLLALVRRKFYEGDDKGYFADKRNLLQWALLWPAREWFKPKDVELPTERYREILASVIIDAAAHVRGRIHYRPAYLKMVIQSHFAIHGEEYYEEAKSLRAATERALFGLGKLPVSTGPSLVDQFTAASKLLDSTKPKRKKATPAPTELQLPGLC